MPRKYDFRKTEAKWQKYWLTNKVYEPDLKRAKKPFYNLMMFPYPSAEGLHIGGVRTFTGVDIYGRMKRMQGYDVFEPIGLDGFGINAENYALKIGKNPLKHSKVTEKNFYHQLHFIGNGFDWTNKLETYDPNYYRWTQWIFTRMFKWGLAYRKKQEVNWCPKDLTVLADEQVIAGECERCGTKVEKKDLEQWFFKITDYADRLLKNLDKLDWTDSVKTAQRKWIGKSEGAEIDFIISQTKFKVTVFTTRPDTVFGATYLVLAPEHPLVGELKTRITNLAEVEVYAKESKAKPEIERTAEDKTKTGVELQGVKAVNPATREEIPVWIADYVLGKYGTGAIMAVPAHDDRDNDFAKAFGLPVKSVIEPETGEKKPDEEFRSSIIAIVENPENNTYLTLNWGPKLGGNLFIGGGREQGENMIDTAKREIREETGYVNVEFAQKTEKMHHHYFAHSKQKQREIEVTGLHFRLLNEEKVEVAREENEKFDIEWISKEDVVRKVPDESHLLSFRTLILGEVYKGRGRLINSDKFNGMDSEEAKGAILKWIGGRKKVQFRLRDWLLSRQRYWGAPIPMIYCMHCAEKNTGERSDMPGWYTVPDKDLPVKLPNVAEFRPTGTDKSPLATVSSFVKTKCPKCKKEARRETDVCDTFIDSSWYFLRYPSAKNKKAPWDPALIKKWLPVTSYIGGAEHAVLHLLYSRFVTMAMKDKKLLPFEEPFRRFRAHGLITKDGAKMSKSKGNVVNPDEYWAAYGADVMRMYLAFLAPLEQGGDFRDAGISGLSRFLDRVWRLSESPKVKTESEELTAILHQTIKKVTEDIEELRYNTAISALMILLTEMEKGAVSSTTWSVFLRLLAPFAPHMTEELWQTQIKKGDSIHKAPWPKFDPKRLVKKTFTLVVQVNGKLRDSIIVPADISEEEAKAKALASEKVKTHVGGEPKRVIYVPGKLVNIVV